jgi:hypothetical protein
VKLLAIAYKLGEPETEPTGPKILNEGSKSSISDVARACEHNLEVASAAGLRCRSAVWATVLTLLPVHTGREGDNTPQMQVPFASELLGYIYIHIYLCIYIHIHIYTYIMYIYIFINIYIYTYIYVYMYIYIYVYIYIDPSC